MSKYRIVCVLLLLILIIPFEICSHAQLTADGTVQALKNEPDKLICVSKYGDILHYPENTLEGIQSAGESGADMVEVTVRKTSDGVLVLFADETLKRMCVSGTDSVNAKISATSYAELSKYHLRSSRGQETDKITAYCVPTLESAVKLLSEIDTVLLIDNGWQYRDEIYKMLSDNGALEKAVIVADAKRADVSNWLSAKSPAPLVFTKYTGTVIWDSIAYINSSADCGALGVILGSGNPYSTTFSVSVVSKTSGKLRAVADMTDPKLCGKREDSEKYWDDMTSRGFSVIITDKTEQFNLYRQRTELSRKNLNELINTVSQANFSSVSSHNLAKIDSSLSRARKVAANSVSAMELENAYNELNESFGLLSGGSKYGMLTVSAGRIIAAVAVIIGFVLFELYIIAIRNRRIALRRKGIDKKGRYRLKKEDRQ